MNNLNIAYAALLHDIGKFYQRTTKISLLNSQEIASTPIHANGYHTHIHSGYTAKFFHDYLHLNDQLEKASSGHHINEVDEFDSIIRDADRIASKIDRNDENFDFEENHKKTRYQYITSRLSSIMGNIDFGQTIYDSKFKLTSIDQCMNPCRNNIEQNTIESIEEYKKLFTQFIEEIKFDNLLIGKPTPYKYHRMYSLLYKYTTLIPSSTYETNNQTVSLFDHLKLTTAIASCLSQNNYTNNQPLFIHSSMFPLNMLPMVHYNIFDIDYINHNILKEKSIDQLSYLQTLKNYKKINYTTESIFNDYIIKSDFNKMRDDLLNKKINIKNYCLQKASENILFEQTKQLNTHVRKKDYYNTSIGDDNALYYDDTIYTNGLFYILVKTNENIKKIKDIFSYSHFFGFGPRHSVGKNSFKLISIEEIKRKPNLNNKLLLSQSVFDECINLSESNYQIISKQYHPSKTYINKTTHKMNLFNEGSYLKLTQDKEWIGKILSFNIDKKPLYYYGIGYII